MCSLLVNLLISLHRLERKAVLIANSSFSHGSSGQGVELVQTCESFLCDANLVCDLSRGPVYSNVYDAFVSAYDAFPQDLGDALTAKVNGTPLVSLPLTPDVDIPFDSSYAVGLDLRYCTNVTSH